MVSDPLRPHGLYSPWNSLGQNTGVGSLSLLQGIFPAQGLNPNLLHCRQILYQLSHQGSPRTLEWVAYPFSSGSIWPRNQTGISCIAAGGFFTNWAIRGALILLMIVSKPVFWDCFLCHIQYKVDGGQEEKGLTEDEMVGWHHQLSGHEFEQTLGDSEGQGSLACCHPWGCKESDMT